MTPPNKSEAVVVSDTIRRHRITWRPLIVVLAIAAVIWVLFAVYMEVYVPDWRTRSQFDVFSAANALFSAFAFAGLIYAIVLQREDLRYQLEELQQTREELRGQNEQLAAQNATFHQQSFETRFFEWLKLHHEIVNAIQYGQVCGRDTFFIFYNVLKDVYTRTLQDASPRHLREIQQAETNADYMQRLLVQSSMSHYEALLKAYQSMYNGAQSKIGHYFRNLYNLIKFVDKSDLSQREKRFYTNIVRAQLSSGELALLFYNCIVPQGSEKFKPLVERYGLLKNMDSSHIFIPEHRSFYLISAYQGSSEIYEDGS